MKWTVRNRWTDAVIFELEAESMRAALEQKVKERANLSGADLSGANLYGANLSGANLSRADLSGADLSGADLSGADLYGANLSGANLYGADLSGADLYGADLSGANLSRADLYGANLSRADLYGADLYGANLSRADLYGANLSRADLSGADLQNLLKSNSVHTLLCAINWGHLPADLTLEMMAHDAESCGIERMDTWANGGNCPFSDSVRDYQFTENRDVWRTAAPEDKIPKLRGMELLKRLWDAVIAEKKETKEGAKC